GDTHPVGDFKDATLEEVRKEILFPANFVKGTFPQSAVPMPPVAFAHIDCDQYRSHVESISYLAPRMTPGGVMWFDDYGGLAGAKKAVDEFFKDRVEMVSERQAIVRF